MSEIRRTYYPSGELYQEYQNKDDKKDGIYITYWLNGKLNNQGYYKQGKLEGINKTWYSCGHLFSECYYTQGKLEGIYKSWHPGGQLREECNYNEDKLNGIYKQWNQDDQLYDERYYINDRSINNFHDALKKIAAFRNRVKCIAQCFNTSAKKFYQLSKMVKTQAFVEWYYHPENYGGRRHKRIMQQWFGTKFNL